VNREGALSIRTLCMPSDANQYGDIFGGWLLGQMDIAGGVFASQAAGGRTATVAVDAMTFRKPVYVGEWMCVYADLIAVGRTSIGVHVEAWVLRRNALPRILVTEGKFVYVALGDDRRPRPVAGRTGAPKTSRATEADSARGRFCQAPTPQPRSRGGRLPSGPRVVPLPAAKRGRITGLTTSLLPAGTLLGALTGAYLEQHTGWRGLFAVGLLPAALTLLICAWVPVSPRWLIGKGRLDEARRSLAWALQVDERQIALPPVAPPAEPVPWRELFR